MVSKRCGGCDVLHTEHAYAVCSHVVLARFAGCVSAGEQAKHTAISKSWFLHQLFKRVLSYALLGVAFPHLRHAIGFNS